MREEPTMLRYVGESETKDYDESKRTITAAITTNAIDRYKEIVEPSGVKLDNYAANPVVLYNHQRSALIGRNQWIKQQKNGLLAQTEFAPTMLGDEIMQLYFDGFMKAWSIGFIGLKWEDSDGSNGWWRRYTEWELLEYSAVTIPANPEALSNALATVHSPILREALEYQRDLNDLRASIKYIQEKTESLQETTEKIDALLQRVNDLEVRDTVKKALQTPEVKRNKTLEMLEIQNGIKRGILETLGDLGLTNK